MRLVTITSMVVGVLLAAPVAAQSGAAPGGSDQAGLPAANFSAFGSGGSNFDFVPGIGFMPVRAVSGNIFFSPANGPFFQGAAFGPGFNNGFFPGGVRSGFNNGFFPGGIRSGFNNGFNNGFFPGGIRSGFNNGFSNGFFPGGIRTGFSNGFFPGFNPGVTTYITPYIPAYGPAVVTTFGGRRSVQPAFGYYPPAAAMDVRPSGGVVIREPAARSASNKRQPTIVIDPEGKQRAATREVEALMKERSLVEGIVALIGKETITVRYKRDGDQLHASYPTDEVFFFNKGHLTSAEMDATLLKQGMQVLVPAK